MAAKIGTRNGKKQNGPVSIPAEERWAVISAETGRSIYLESTNGIDQKEAERLAARLQVEAVAVPRASLNRSGRYEPELYAALAAREEEGD